MEQYINILEQIDNENNKTQIAASLEINNLYDKLASIAREQASIVWQEHGSNSIIKSKAEFEILEGKLKMSMFLITLNGNTFFKLQITKLPLV
jgi:hypothetical protein